MYMINWKGKDIGGRNKLGGCFSNIYKGWFELLIVGIEERWESYL